MSAAYYPLSVCTTGVRFAKLSDEAPLHERVVLMYIHTTTITTPPPKPSPPTHSPTVISGFGKPSIA